MFYILIFILGLIVGSFLNVVIIRLNNGKKIVNSRSACSSCQQQLKVRDLIPLVSFIMSRGKCRYCHKPISWQYPLVELAAAVLFVLVTYNIFGWISPAISFYNFNIILLWARNLIFVCFLIIIFVYDFRWYLILDLVTIPAMIVAESIPSSDKK